MVTAVVLSIVLPIVAGAAYLALRHRLPQVVADVRGIALQTVIIMVVLLAIAGAVAGVLIARGDQAVEDLQRQDVDRPAQASDVTSQIECIRWGYTWTPSTATTTTHPGGTCG